MQRRTFLRNSALAAAAGFSGVQAISAAPSLKLAYSTLGCPDWSYEQALAFAARHGYSGLEIRGIKRELDLTKCPEFRDAGSIRASLTKARDAGIRIVDLGTSTALHMPAGAERSKMLDEGRRFITLAAALECPYIRVFPNNLPKGQDKSATLGLIREGLAELAKFGQLAKVRVLMETHGDVVYAEDLVSVMEPLKGFNTGLVWDIVNMWSVTKEAPADAYTKLKPYIFHTHVKDYRMEGTNMRYTLLGKGISPIMDAVKTLHKDAYPGYYSFEWEKLWHPEIEAPELAIADYAETMRKALA
jgi:sugar phosphate isomerase/epimerase